MLKRSLLLAAMLSLLAFPVSVFAWDDPPAQKCEHCLGGFDPNDPYSTMHLECAEVADGEMGSLDCHVNETRDGDTYDAECQGSQYCMTITVYPGGGGDGR